MSRPLLYQPTQRWRIAVALAGAILIHALAVALALTRPYEPVYAVGDNFAILDGSIDLPIDNVTPPDPPLVPIRTDETFPDFAALPHPVLRQKKRVFPIGPRNQQILGLQGLAVARTNALNAPRPEYPYEARRLKITGNGIVTMRIDFTSGTVIDVDMEQSTGNLVLDKAAILAFKRGSVL